MPTATTLRLPTGELAAVLDVGLSEADGRDVCQTMRANGCRAPVVFLRETAARDGAVRVAAPGSRCCSCWS